MSKTRKVLIGIVSFLVIISIGVLVIAYINGDKIWTVISAVFAILMVGIRALIPLIPLDKSKASPASPIIETDPNDKLPGNVPGKFHYFTGRETILNKIHREFRPEDTNSSTRILILNGLGGVGKSEIAKAYAIKHQEDYTRIWWIDAERVEGIWFAYTNFAEENGLTQGIEKADDSIKEVMNWMRNHDRWLFIFDNAKNKESIEKYIPKLNAGNILITSRYTQWEEFKQLEIKEFEKEEARNFLKNYTEQHNDKGLEELIEELGYFPLALRHAGAYMKKSKTNYNEYLRMFRKNKTEKSPYYSDRVTQIVAETLKTSFKLIHKKASRQLLNLCAFMAPKDINQQWFENASEKLPSPLREAVKEKQTYDDILTELTAYSLVTLDYEGNLSIHRLVQEVIRDNLKQEQAEWRTCCVEILNKLRYYDFSTVEYRARFRSLVPHIIFVTTGPINDELTEKVANLYYFLGCGFDESADYSQSLEYYNKALTIREKVLGKEHPDTARIYNNIAVVYDHKGDYDRALEFYGKALTICEKVSGKEHPNTASTYNNMAVAYDHKGDYDRALEYHDKALKIREKVLGEEHPDTATTYNNMALVYSEKGDYDRALEFYGKALTIHEKVLGKEHPNTATTYNNMAVVYYTKSDYDRALEFYIKALTIREKVLGKENPKTKIVYNNLVKAYEKSGKSEPFEEWLKKNRKI